MVPSRWWWLVIIATFIAAAILGWLWVEQPEELAVIDIMASREPDLGLPVYAQFTVTQLVELPQPAEITKLIIPMYIPAAGQPLTISLIQDGQVLQGWRLRLNTIGLQAVYLPLDKTRILQGQLEVIFDGTAISHEAQAAAPRLFIESFDAAYLDGHYRIAANDKQGDVALLLMAQQTHGQRLAHDWRQQPTAVVQKIILLLTTLIFVSALPMILINHWAGTNQRTS